MLRSACWGLLGSTTGVDLFASNPQRILLEKFATPVRLAIHRLLVNCPHRAANALAGQSLPPIGQFASRQRGQAPA